MENPNSRYVNGYPAPNGYPAAASPPPPYAYAGGGPPSQNGYYNYQAANPYDKSSIHHSNRGSTCIHVFFALTLSFILFFGSVSFVVWLIYRPQLPEFRMESLSLSNLTISSNSLISFTSEIHLTAYNPNKKLTVDYDHSEAGIFYKSYSLAETSLGPFTQDTKEKTYVTGNFAAGGSFVDKWVVDGIMSERGREGKVWLNLKMLSRVKMTATFWRTRRRLLKIFCRDLVVAIPSNGSTGTLVGGQGKCGVGY